MKPVNQQLIKDTNMKLIYQLICQSPGISRALAAQTTGLSKTTVSTLVDELIERAFIYDSGARQTGSIGRSPNCLWPRMNSHYVIVFHWMGDTVYGQLMDIVGVSRYSLQCRINGGETYVHGSLILYEQILQHCAPPQILGICVVVSACIDSPQDEIYSTTLALPLLGKDSPFSALRSVFPQYPVAMMEDTACCAYAEKVYAGVSDPDFAFVNFSRGIGACIFIGGEMVGNPNGMTTQFGHYTVDPDGPLCPCGNHGCLEVKLSEPYLADRCAGFSGTSPLHGMQEVTYRDLGRAAALQDPEALSLVSQMARELSIALANLVCTVNSSLIILGGRIPSLGPRFLEELRTQLQTTGFRRFMDHTTVRYSSLQEDSLYQGAMKYFFDIHYRFSTEGIPSFYVG